MTNRQNQKEKRRKYRNALATMAVISLLAGCAESKAFDTTNNQNSNQAQTVLPKNETAADLNNSSAKKELQATKQMNDEETIIYIQKKITDSKQQIDTLKAMADVRQKSITRSDYDAIYFNQLISYQNNNFEEDWSKDLTNALIIYYQTLQAATYGEKRQQPKDAQSEFLHAYSNVMAEILAGDESSVGSKKQNTKELKIAYEKTKKIDKEEMTDDYKQ